MARNTRISLIRGLFTTLFSLLLGGCALLLPPACKDCPDTHESWSITLAAVGDTNGYNIVLSREDPEDPLAELSNIISPQDVFLFNMEGVLLSQEPPAGMCHDFPQQSLLYSLPQVADFLHPTRHAIATLANNHILDCGDHGIQETVYELNSRGILVVGAGENVEKTCRPLLLQINNVRLAVVAYLAIGSDWFSATSDRAGAASWDKCNGEKQVAELKTAVDVVVVALHLHLAPGWTEQTAPEHIDLVQRVLDAGADVVIAHGPHVPQGVYEKDGKIALLSLGNFLFQPGYEMPEAAHRSLIALVKISPTNVALTLQPVRLDDSGRPRIPTSSDAMQILSDIASLSTEFGTTVEIREGIGYVTVPRQR